MNKPRGFATLSPERHKEISSKGGKAAHANGLAHQFSSEEARIAGRKGGLAPHVSRGKKAPESGTAVAFDDLPPLVPTTEPAPASQAVV